MTEMEKRIDDDDDSDGNATKNSSQDNKPVSAFKSTNSTDPTSTSTSTSIDSARKPSDCTDAEWDKAKSIKPLQRLFVQSHANANDTPEQRRRCDDCVQIPIEHIELVEDDEGMIIVHDVSFVQSSDTTQFVKLFTMSVLIASGICLLESCIFQSNSNCVLSV